MTFELPRIRQLKDYLCEFLEEKAIYQKMFDPKFAPCKATDTDIANELVKVLCKECVDQFFLEFVEWTQQQHKYPTDNILYTVLKAQKLVGKPKLLLDKVETSFYNSEKQFQQQFLSNVKHYPASTLSILKPDTIANAKKAIVDQWSHLAVKPTDSTYIYDFLVNQSDLVVKSMPTGNMTEMHDEYAKVFKKLVLPYFDYNVFISMCNKSKDGELKTLLLGYIEHIIFDVNDQVKSFVQEQQLTQIDGKPGKIPAYERSLSRAIILADYTALQNLLDADVAEYCKLADAKVKKEEPNLEFSRRYNDQFVDLNKYVRDKGTGSDIPLDVLTKSVEIHNTTLDIFYRKLKAINKYVDDNRETNEIKFYFALDDVIKKRLQGPILLNTPMVTHVGFCDERPWLVPFPLIKIILPDEVTKRLRMYITIDLEGRVTVSGDGYISHKHKFGDGPNYFEHTSVIDSNIVLRHNDILCFSKSKEEIATYIFKTKRENCLLNVIHIKDAVSPKDIATLLAFYQANSTNTDLVNKANELVLKVL